MSDLDFIKLVENPTWKDILVGLVHREELDPWNIDIGEITSKYLEVVRNMKKVDLHIPANIILAAAILLRFKSENLEFKEDEPEMWEEELPPELDFNPDFTHTESVPTLVFRPRFPKKRKVTLQELVQAVDEALKVETKRESRRRERKEYVEQIENLNVEEIDVEEIIRGVYSKVLEKVDKYNIAKFSDLAGETAVEKVRNLLALLYLASSDYVEVFQEKLFDEIFVRITNRVDPKEISLKIVI